MKKMLPKSWNVAFKCTYNDGGEDKEQDKLGFKDTCSITNITQNIKAKRVWCSNKKCGCHKYFNSGFKGKAPEKPCLESHLFKDWTFDSGMYHNRVGKEGCGIPFKRNVKKKFAILTTRFPKDKEKDRKVIGLFKIDRVEHNNNNETFFISENKKTRIELSQSVAKKINFWDFYKNNKGAAAWGTGVFRYLSDEQVASILEYIRAITSGEINQKVSNILKSDFNNVQPRMIKTEKIEKINREFDINKKYGLGGEGKDHKKLKQWILDNPEKIGMKNIKNKFEEYPFMSGDRADILFEHKDGKFSVIEVETSEAKPGFLQALKYKVLKCVEIEENIVSDVVKAIIVAWEIDDDTKQLCKKYGIDYIEKKI
ncbi:MAG: hypothetical protein N2746_05485 [Deltaproteobacteria bacterium]|nr:hypothetical protein [Deltaproteobacteria bacterium]